MAKRPRSSERRPSFDEVLKEALDDFTEHGYDREERLAFWQQRLREALEASMTPEHRMEEMIREAQVAIYRRLIEKGMALRAHPGVSRYTVDKVKPQLRALLARTIMANANLIKLNRAEEINATLRRFSGWATSVPAGGSDQVDTRQEKEKIRKSLSGLSFRERRVMVDQGHKLTAAVNEVIAQGGGAVGGYWHSNWRQANYDYREDHKERDGVFYLVRDSWAMEKGYLKRGGKYLYTDEVTKPGEEVFCRCAYRYVYNLRDCPRDAITAKGQDALEQARATIKRAAA